MASSKPLSERERRFVDAYMGEAAGNGTEAARAAGYTGSAKVLQVQGSRLLSKAIVKDAIEVARQAATDEAIADRGERKRLLTTMLRDGEVPPRDRIKACETLGKMEGDFVEKREVTLKVPGSVTFNVMRQVGAECQP